MWQLKGDDMKRQIWKGLSIELFNWKPYDTLCKDPLVLTLIFDHIWNFNFFELGTFDPFFKQIIILKEITNYQS
jgi:hypothetical protein